MRAPSVTILSLANAPARYDGQTVRLVGHLEAVNGRLYVLRGRGLLWAARITVIARDRDALGIVPPAPGDEVEVRGIARQHMSAALARELGQKEVGLVGDGPYVLASDIRRRS